MYRRIQTLLIALFAVVALGSAAWAQPVRTAISIYTVPGGGIVYLDNQRLGPAPVTDWATETGVHKLVVHVNGQVAASQMITVKPGGQRFTLKLKNVKSVKPASKAH